MFSISYLLVTKNKLPFIKIVLNELLPQLREDEEIVVVDGNSTDGTKEYLQKLFDEGKLHQFISEPDNNQAHGWNKAMLMANGVLLKKIMDDDVYDYNTIRKCRDFMLQYPEIDVCISNCLVSGLANPDKIDFATRLPWFKNWQAGQVSAFTFSDVYMLIRKSSLSFIGLYDTQFTMMDWEYSLRVSYLNAKIAYYTGCNSLAVSTPANVTSTVNKKLLDHEGNIGILKYNYPGDNVETSLYSHIKIFIGKFLFRFKIKPAAELSTATRLPAEEDLKKYYTAYYKILKEYNTGTEWEFI